MYYTTFYKCDIHLIETISAFNLVLKMGDKDFAKNVYNLQPERLPGGLVTLYIFHNDKLINIFLYCKHFS